MVSLVMLAIMVGCAVLLYLKGTLVHGVVLIFNALFAGFAALGFFEPLARFLIKYSPGIAVWAPMISFLLLFILIFAVLEAMVMQFGKDKADLGFWPEQIGRVLCGVFLGYIMTGHVLVALATVPYPLFNKYPYERFAERNPNPSSATKPFLSPDGFVTGLFGKISQGSFRAISSPRSFALLRADFVDQLYLNRLKLAQEVSLTTSIPALTVEKGHVWYAPDNLRDTDAKPVSAPPGANLMLVRMGIKNRAIKDAGKFTLSQVRLVCSPKTDSENPLIGQGQAVYPLGYIGADARLERKSLAEILTMEASGMAGDSQTIDLVFSVPTNMAATVIEFKLNNAVQLPAPVSGEDAPAVLPFGSAAKASPAKPRPQSDETRPTTRRDPDGGRERRGLSDISQSITGPLDEE
ncbi:MAG: CvpA family protein [Sedimentisphaerales bacterium]|nr:CvpA family protein [Sedimentisphaerales bacterium]